MDNLTDLLNSLIAIEKEEEELRNQRRHSLIRNEDIQSNTSDVLTNQIVLLENNNDNRYDENGSEIMIIERDNLNNIDDDVVMSVEMLEYDSEEYETEEDDDSSSDDDVEILLDLESCEYIPPPPKIFTPPPVIVPLDESKKMIKIERSIEFREIPCEKNKTYLKLFDFYFTPVHPNDLVTNYYRNLAMCYREVIDGKNFGELKSFNTSKIKYKVSTNRYGNKFYQLVEIDDSKNTLIYTATDTRWGIWSCGNKSFQLLKLDGESERKYSYLGPRNKEWFTIVSSKTIFNHWKLFSGKYTVLFFNRDHDFTKTEIGNVYRYTRNPNEETLDFNIFEGIVTECFVNVLKNGSISVINSKTDHDCENENYGEFKLLSEPYYKTGNKITGYGSVWIGTYFLIMLLLKW